MNPGGVSRVQHQWNPAFYHWFLKVGGTPSSRGHLVYIGSTESRPTKDRLMQPLLVSC